MNDTFPKIRTFLENPGTEFKVWECSPELAAAALFCQHYQTSLEHSANAILEYTQRRSLRGLIQQGAKLASGSLNRAMFFVLPASNWTGFNH